MTLDLIQRFNPVLYLAKNERLAPISADLYLSQCAIRSWSDPTVCMSATHLNCYQQFLSQTPSLYLTFTNPNWQQVLFGDPKAATCYAHVLDGDGPSFAYVPGGHMVPRTCHLIVYFYLFSRTDPEKCCGCGCPWTAWAHVSDLKFIAVEVEKLGDLDWNLSRVFYGAHGYQAGEWRQSNQITKQGDRPVAFSCLADHSFYPEASNHWRIFGLTNDHTDAGILCDPVPQQVFSPSEHGFVPDTMGWVTFPGNMNDKGVAAPMIQSWFRGDLPIQSNNWWRRLYCRDYW